MSYNYLDVFSAFENAGQAEVAIGFEDNNAVTQEEIAAACKDVTLEQVIAELDIIVNAKPLQELRVVRDRLIAETDWWASSDLTMTQEQIDYRQALRDITNIYQSLDTVVWPIKPGAN